MAVAKNYSCSAPKAPGYRNLTQPSGSLLSSLHSSALPRLSDFPLTTGRLGCHPPAPYRGAVSARSVTRTALPSPGTQRSPSLQMDQKSKHNICADKQKLSVGCECTFFKAKPSWSAFSSNGGRGRTEIKGKISKNAVCKVEALASAPAQAAKAELTPTLQISADRELAI